MPYVITEWLSPRSGCQLLDYMKKVRSNISTVVYYTVNLLSLAQFFRRVCSINLSMRYVIIITLCWRCFAYNSTSVPGVCWWEHLFLSIIYHNYSEMFSKFYLCATLILTTRRRARVRLIKNFRTLSWALLRKCFDIQRFPANFRSLPLPFYKRAKKCARGSLFCALHLFASSIIQSY